MHNSDSDKDSFIAGKIIITMVVLTLLCWHAEVRAQDKPPRLRLTPPEVEAMGKSGPSAGTSGVAGIETTVLKGDPTKAGLYTILLKVPSNTRIEAHTHPDDRVATVISGTWYFGYGDRFDERKLKALPPGSFYTEPPDEPHFASTGDKPVVVQITGFGPTGTHYTDGNAAPRTSMSSINGSVRVPGRGDDTQPSLALASPVLTTIRKTKEGKK
jgi:quercetin dioxygenase-like cupin family protein